MKFPEYYTCQLRERETDDIVEKKVHAVLNEMTLEEKLSIVHGVTDPEECGIVGNAAYSCGVPRLGIPEMRMYDGPAGVQSLYDTTGLPCQQVLGSSWSRKLAYGYGKIMAQENAAISGNVQFGAQYDMVRTCHYARSRDSMSEDPYLTSELAVEETKGMQENGVICNVKHLATYCQDLSSAQQRDIYMDEQTLHEMYLLPFEKAMKEGNAGSAMTCHALLMGQHSSSSSYLLKDILRHEWKWKGFVINDWGGNHTFSLPLGLDMETPYGNHNSSRVCREKLKIGELSEKDLNTAVKHVLYGMASAGFFTLVQLDENGRALTEEGRTEPIKLPVTYHSNRDELLQQGAEYSLELAQKGAVLLKNEKNALPIKEEDYRKGRSVAFIGLGAVNSICGEGRERSFGTLRYMDSPYDCVKKITGNDADIYSAVGVDIVGETIAETYLYTDEQCTQHGVKRTYGVTAEDGTYVNPYQNAGGENIFRNDDTGENKGFYMWNAPNLKCDVSGHETGSLVEVCKQIDYTVGSLNGRINRTYKNGKDGTAFPCGEGYTWKGYIKVPETGVYRINLCAIGGMACLKLDLGEGLKDLAVILGRDGTQWPWSQIIPTQEGMGIDGKELILEKDVVYPFQITAVAKYKEKDMQVRLAWITPQMRKEHLNKARELARKCDKTVLFLWKQSGGTGAKRIDVEELLPANLPEKQSELLHVVADEVHRNQHQLIVVVHCGTGMVLSEVEKEADGILYMYLPGECGGLAAANLLLGKVNPSGKTSGVFPKRNEDTCITDTLEHTKQRYSGNQEIPAKVFYSEGIFTSYRWNDQTGVEPLYPFGYGLSYSNYAYSNLSVTETDGKFVVSVDITNVGNMTGDEIVQMYIGKPDYEIEGIQMAEKQLCGFDRVENIHPGETKRAIMKIEERALAVWDSSGAFQVRKDGTKDKWRKLKGARKLYVGRNAGDLQLQKDIVIK